MLKNQQRNENKSDPHDGQKQWFSNTFLIYQPPNYLILHSRYLIKILLFCIWVCGPSFLKQNYHRGRFKNYWTKR